jgi:holin-like protein
MLKAFLLLIAAQLVGSELESAAHLPLPGPVIGLFLLALLLAVRPAWQSSGLTQVSGGLLRHMGLLFVPAGVGLIDHLDLLSAETLPLLGGLVGSTLLSLVATALILEWHGRLSARLPGGIHVHPAR